MHLPRLLREIMYLRPVIIPHLHLRPRKLPQHALIPHPPQTAKHHIFRALHHGLTITIDAKLTIHTIPHPELFGGTHKPHILAIADEDGTLTWATKHKTVGAVVDVQICGDVENEVGAVVAVVDVELLLGEGLGLLYSEAVGLLYEAVVVEVYFASGGGSDQGLLFWLLGGRWGRLGGLFADQAMRGFYGH